MRIRHAKEILVTTGVAIVALLFWKLWAIEPSYEGHGLSEWLELRDGYTYTTNHWATLLESESAIRHIGRPAIPFMLRWIQYVQVPRRTYIEAVVDPIAVVRSMMGGFDQEEFRAEGAVAAFEIIGSNANSALPELARIASIPPNPDWGIHVPAWGIEVPSMPNRRAIFALANIGPAAVPYLLNLATNRSTNIQCDAVYLLSQMGTNALPAIPLLLGDIQNPANRVASMAAQTLGVLKLSPEIVVPALTNALANKKFLLEHETNGLMDPKMQFLYEDFRSLAAYGPQGRSALPAIIEWLQDGDWFGAWWAADALGNFTSEPELVVPALTRCLESRNSDLVQSAAQSLGAFGSAATPAVPVLVKISDNTNLMWNARIAAGRALMRITNSVPASVSWSPAR